MENEIELIKGCRTGDEAARKKLYLIYSERMLAICYRYIGDIDAAHDVLHDAFMKIFTRFSFRGESSLSTWITKVVISHALDYLRKQQRDKKWLLYDDQITDIPELDKEEYLLSEEQLLLFVAELPQGCRTVFNLYVFEDKTHKEIADLLGIKEHSSTSQLHRAKYLLAKKIKEFKKYEERTG